MKTIINKIKRLNEALPLLLLTIIIYGILVELIGVWFASDKLRYTTGLIIGLACAVGMAVHISMVISDSVREGKNNPKILSFKSMTRYFVVCIVMFVTMQFKLGSLLSAIVGLFGLKVAAYAQPLVYKIIKKFKGGEGSKNKTKEEEVKM